MIFEHGLNLRHSRNSSRQLLARVDHNRLSRRRPHCQVTALITDVVETSLAKLTHETLSFLFPGEIGDAIAGQNQIEKF